MPVIIDGTNGITQAGEFNSDSSFGFKNRIINGAMVISQYNGTSSTTPVNNVYFMDRWYVACTQASKLTEQQNQGAVTPPAGFTNYLGLTSSSSYSVVAADFFVLVQRIEGYNVADLRWGTADAKTVTLSFQVYSSLTGTFGGSLANDGGGTSYPFTYSIPTANTWTQISVTIVGPTIGSWNTTNGMGIQVVFGLGVGSTYSGTAGSWSANTYLSATGATSVVGTNGATFYITGVQLEVGSTATSFDYRPYGTELALCQRYYYKIFPAANSKGYGNGTAINTTNIYNTVPSPVTMRVDPTLETTGTASDYAVVRGGGTNTACSNVPTITDQSHRFVLQVNGFLSSGLVDGYSGWLRTNSTSSYLGFNAEL